MGWLQRYVDHVKTYLPGRQREDIGNELYSTLQDQCDDMAEDLGREPGEAEILQMLKDKGHPMQVAAAYGPRRVLVSESLFPLYLLALKWMLAIVCIVNAVEVVLSLPGQVQPNFIGAAVGWLADSFNGCLYGFAWVTLAFFLAGESIHYSDFFGKWDPRKLPAIAGGNQPISRFDSAVELVAMLLLMGWLNSLFGAVSPVAGEGVRFVFSEELKALLPWINIALGLSILIATDKLVRPYWTRPRLLVDGTINIYWLALLVLLFNLDQVFSLHRSGQDSWVMEAGNWQVIVLVALAITAYDLFRNIQRLIRATNNNN